VRAPAGRRGEFYATSLTTLPVGCARRLRYPVRRGAGLGHTVPWNLGFRSLTSGQPTAVREHSAAECSRAGQGRALGGVEQHADE
jgi:hypothetical protein